MQGKKGIWMKILQEQVDLVPIAIQVWNFSNYHLKGLDKELPTERHVVITVSFSLPRSP